MEVEQLSAGDNKVSFVVRKTDHVYLNTLRRMIVNRVPSMAIDEITFIENGSALYDEMVAHRLGLIPLTTDLEGYNLKESCKCKGNGCARCTVTLHLEKEGPCIVYAEELKFADKAVKAVHPKMPIVKLLAGQRMKIEATATLGYGKQHIKYAPGKLFYQGYPKIKAGQSENAKAVAESCPVDILQADGKKIKVTDETKCVLCMACVDADKEAMRVEASDSDFIVHAESWGQLPVADMLKEAVNVFDSELDAFEEALKEAKK
ncbi:DNA-directed RNA polymerase subunit D [Candidatus Woesearchaeota archaeon]|nr:DNA-directed RNA polymerase subunit D [Candidatus Woesearchaeota archaeon]